MNKKVALVGNSNNNLFSICRHLRELKIDANLFLMNEDPHFMPEKDSYNLDYMSFTKHVKWENYNFYDEKLVDEINKDLENYSIIFASAFAPMYIELANKKIDFFIPIGNDLYSLPFYEEPKFNFFYRLKRKIFPKKDFESMKKKMSLSQLNAIKKSKYIITSNKDFRPYLKKINCIEKVIPIQVPMLFHKNYVKSEISKFYDKSHWFKDFKKYRDNFDLIIFHHSRHVWKTKIDNYSDKGNNKLFYAFKKFLELENVNAAIITTEYGCDFQHSKELVKDLKLEKNVIWFPKLERKEIMIGLSLSDIGTSDFSIGWATGGVIFEVICAKIPLIGYRNNDLYENEKLYPIYNSKSIDEIYKSLKEIYNNKSKAKENALKSYKWFEEFAVTEPINKIVELI